MIVGEALDRNPVDPEIYDRVARHAAWSGDDEAVLEAARAYSILGGKNERVFREGLAAARSVSDTRLEADFLAKLEPADFQQ